MSSSASGRSEPGSDPDRLAFGRELLAPAAFRVTIATFNVRALRVVQALGFRPVTSFRATADGRSYAILTRPEQAGNR